VRTSSRYRIFHTVTMSLCIAYKHFCKLTLKKYKPDAIALQYSVNCSKVQNADKGYRINLLFLPTLQQSDQYSDVERVTYLIDAAILAGISTRCAVARAICGESDTYAYSSCPEGRLFSIGPSNKLFLPCASPLNRSEVSTCILRIVISTNRGNVSGRWTTGGCQRKAE